MKYIKLFEDKEIDWEDIDIEEEWELNNPFIKYLKDKDIYDKFMDLFRNSDWRIDNPNGISTHDFDEYLNKTAKEKYIYNAFDWDNANDSIYYWGDANEDWKDFLHFWKQSK